MIRMRIYWREGRRRTMRALRLAIAMVVFGCMGSGLPAQTDTGSIAGTVTDPTGAVDHVVLDHHLVRHARRHVVPGVKANAGGDVGVGHSVRNSF